jgi:hypothetical protein
MLRCLVFYLKKKNARGFKTLKMLNAYKVNCRVPYSDCILLSVKINYVLLCTLNRARRMRKNVCNINSNKLKLALTFNFPGSQQTATQCPSFLTFFPYAIHFSNVSHVFPLSVKRTLKNIWFGEAGRGGAATPRNKAAATNQH